MKRLLVLLLFCLVSGPHLLLAAPVVLFDEGHGQQFLAGGERPLDLAALAGVFTAAGGEVRTSGQPLTETALAGIDVLVISGAFQPLSDQEVVKMLADKGIVIARRTVAKYRTELNILPSNLRRSF